MTDWYIPVTIVPGLGLIILSTSNQLMALSDEIKILIERCIEIDIIKRKLSQLKLLNNNSCVLLYLCCLITCFRLGERHVRSTAAFVSDRGLGSSTFLCWAAVPCHVFVQGLKN